MMKNILKWLVPFVAIAGVARAGALVPVPLTVTECPTNTAATKAFTNAVTSIGRIYAVEAVKAGATNSATASVALYTENAGNWPRLLLWTNGAVAVTATTDYPRSMTVDAAGGDVVTTNAVMPYVLDSKLVLEARANDGEVVGTGAIVRVRVILEAP